MPEGLRLRRRHQQRGASLITALMLGALALTLALTLAGMSFSHLTVSSRLSNINQARSLAEAVVSQGIERVVTTEGKAFSPGHPLQRLSISLNGAPGGWGKLTFVADEAETDGLPLSTNNIKGDTATSGYRNRVVPENSVHLVGMGVHNGVTRRVEAIIHFPSYRFAVSSKGQISSRGELIIAGAEEPADLLPSVRDSLASDELLPGHIASNSGMAAALTLDALSKSIHITGDARAAGGIENPEDKAIIDGSPRANAGEIDLPKIDLRDFDPSTFGAPQGLPDDIPADLHLQGTVKHTGSVVLEQLTLPTDNTGAMLWVDGDLTISDGMRGVGAIFATGNITILSAGQSNLQSDNVCAVVAGKKLKVTGAGNQDSSFFQGVLASGDDMEFSNVTVAGAAVSGVTALDGNDLSAPNPGLTLTDANMVNIEANVAFEYDFEVSLGAGGGGSAAEGWSAPETPPSLSIDSSGRPGVDLSHFYDRASDNFVPGPGGWGSWDGFAPYSYNEATHTHSGSPFGFRARDGAGGWKWLTRAELAGQLYSIGANHPPITNGKKPGDPGYRQYSSWALYFADPFSKCHSMDEVIDGMVDFNVHGTEGMQAKFGKLNDWYDLHPGQPQQNGSFSMDPNQFVQWEGRTKIVLWREL